MGNAFRLVFERLGLARWGWFGALEKYLQKLLASIARAAGRFPKTSFFLMSIFMGCWEELWEMSGIPQKWHEMNAVIYQTYDDYVLGWMGDLTGVKPKGLGKYPLKVWAGQIAAGRVGELTGFHLNSLYPPAEIANEVMMMVTGAIANGGQFEGMQIFTASDANMLMANIQSSYNQLHEHAAEEQEDKLQQKRAWKNSHPQRAIVVDVGNPLVDAARRDAVARLQARHLQIRLEEQAAQAAGG